MVFGRQTFIVCPGPNMSTVDCPITMKFRTRQQTSEPQTIYSCCWRLRFLTRDIMIFFLACGAVETLACGLCSNSISRSPKLPLMFILQLDYELEILDHPYHCPSMKNTAMASTRP